MECECCERETDNEMEIGFNDHGREVWLVYCDECKKIKNETDDE